MLLLIPLAVYFSFGLYHLDKFETADEHFWVYQDRVHRYWQAIGDGNWKGTRINDKPGITLAYVSGVGILFEGESQEKRVSQSDGLFEKYDPQAAQHILRVFRLPLIVFNGLFSFYFFWIIRKLLGSDWTALFASTLILLSPVLVGISQIVNPDSLSWVFIAATILTYLAYLESPTGKYLFLTALLFGLALATKYIAAILLPFLFLIMLFHFLVISQDKEKNFKETARIAKDYFLLIAGALATFSFLMPAVWVKPAYLTKDLLGSKGMEYVFWPVLLANLLIWSDARFLQGRILSRLFSWLQWVKKIVPLIVFGMLLIIFVFVLVNWTFGFNWWDLDSVPFDSRQSDFFGSLSFMKQFILQARPLVFSLTPLVLLGLLGTWAWMIKKESIDKQTGFTVFVLSLFFLVYYVAVSAQGLLVTIRYGIILYPLAAVIAAIGIHGLMQKMKLSQRLYPIVFGVMVVLGVWSLGSIAPYYFNYSSSLLPKKYVITNAWGYGGYEAAEYINRSGVPGIGVVSDYSGVCSFVEKPCLEMSNDVRSKVIRRFADREEEFFFVLTRRGQARWNYVGEFKQFNGQEALWEENIDGRPDNFIRVYRGK